MLITNQGTVMLTDQAGGIDVHSEQALFFARDTRFVSQYQLFINERWELFTSAATRYDEAQVQLTNLPLSLRGRVAGRDT